MMMRKISLSGVVLGLVAGLAASLAMRPWIGFLIALALAIGAVASRRWRREAAA